MVALTGDGGFNMTLGELETARRAGCGLTVHRRQQRRLRLRQSVAARHVRAGATSRRTSKEMDYAAIARTMGCGGIRVEDPEGLSAAFARAWKKDRPTVIDVVVTRDPGQMLPAVDSRTVEIKQGDRVA